MSTNQRALSADQQPSAPHADSSAALFERARRLSPGGVHSPVRAFRGVGGTPRFMSSGAGARLRDVDGREYLDFCLAFGPLILGHADAGVRAAAEAALARGWSLGTAEPYSLELAEFITAHIPWVQSLRFVNSGTEAVMSALRVARAATGRSKIVKFEGCYHGHVDSMLVRAGSGLAEAPQLDSAGLAPEVAQETLVAPLDDSGALEAIFARHGEGIAATIIEPVPANYGLLPQRLEFLQAVAAVTRAHGALLIFDEVISGFRVAFQGYAGVSGIHPDLVIYGKIIGGGFPVGAYGGRRELMELVAPAGPVYQAGTLSANPLAMCAGLANLRRLADGSVYRRLESLGERLQHALSGLPGIALTRCGSIFWLLSSKSALPSLPVRTLKSFPVDAAACFAPLFHALLERGIYLSPSAFEVGFLCSAHTEADIDGLARALREVTRPA
jgi:glutamate-1-semialdehyde 2,1-aminomutase